VKSAFVAIVTSFLLTLYFGVLYGCYRDDAICVYQFIKNRIALAFHVHQDFSDFGVLNTLEKKWREGFSENPYSGRDFVPPVTEATVG
jgi:hypothetical protein